MKCQKGGQVIGATDAYGESPSERPVRPKGLALTMLKILGVDPRKKCQTPDGRPMKILADGELVSELL